jgi:thiamine transport system permease protein
VSWLTLCALAIAVAIPVAAVGWRAVHPAGELSLDAVTRVVSSPRTWRLLAVTVAQAAVSTVVTVLVGLPVAWVVGTFRFRGRRLVRTVALVPFVLPSVVLATAVAAVLGPSGLVDARGTWWAVIIAHLSFNLAVIVLVVGGAVADRGRSLDDAGRLLGVGPIRSLWRVTVPAVAPAIASAAAVVFLFCLTSFGVVVILGGGAVTTLEVEIWVRATRQYDLSGAAVLAVVQVVAVVAALGLHARVSRRAGAEGGRSVRRHPAVTSERVAVVLASVAVALVAGVPLAAVAVRSFHVGPDLTFANWSGLGSVTQGTGLAISPVQVALTSFVTASVATVLAATVAVPVSALVAHRPGGAAERISLLPIAVSAITIGFGLVLVAGRPPVDLRRSWWLIPVAQALVAVPLVVRVVAPALRAVPRAAVDTAAMLGASPRARWWRVELPAVRGAVAGGAALAFVASLGEFGATVFLARPERTTLPVAIERLMSRPGPAGFGQAMALSCVLVLVCGAVLVVIDTVAERRGGRAGAGARGTMAAGTSSPT